MKGVYSNHGSRFRRILGINRFDSPSAGDALGGFGDDDCEVSVILIVYTLNRV